MSKINENPMEELFEVVKARKETFTEGSYTCYLFEKGLDKILKKCGEECSEAIIAAKSHEAALVMGSRDATSHDATIGGSAGDEIIKTAKNELENEICDLLYHLTVLMVQQGVKLEDINEILADRSLKIGNLKTAHQTDHNS